MLTICFKRYGCPSCREPHFLIGARARRSLSHFTNRSFSRVKSVLFCFPAATSVGDDLLLLEESGVWNKAGGCSGEIGGGYSGEAGGGRYSGDAGG